MQKKQWRCNASLILVQDTLKDWREGAVMEHYSEDVAFRSPTVVRRRNVDSLLADPPEPARDDVADEVVSFLRVRLLNCSGAIVDGPTRNQGQFPARIS